MYLSAVRAKIFKGIVQFLQGVLESIIGRSLEEYGSALVYALLCLPFISMFLYKWWFKAQMKYWLADKELRESIDIRGGLSIVFIVLTLIDIELIWANYTAIGLLIITPWLYLWDYFRFRRKHPKYWPPPQYREALQGGLLFCGISVLIAALALLLPLK